MSAIVSLQETKRGGKKRHDYTEGQRLTQTLLLPLDSDFFPLKAGVSFADHLNELLIIPLN